MIANTLSELPGLYTINRFYPNILFSVESPDTEFKERDENKQLSVLMNCMSFRHYFF